MKTALLLAALVFLGHAAFLPNFIMGHRDAGDEPEYMLMAQSIWRDGDIDLANNVQPVVRSSYCERPKVRYSGLCDNGRMLPIHNIGLPLILSPFAAAGGLNGACIFMLFIGSLLAANMFLLIRRFDVETVAAFSLTLIICFTPPVGIYSYLIYTEIIAAAIIVYCMRLLVAKGRPDIVSLCVFGGLLAFLPWLHYGHAATAVIILAAAFCFHPDRRKFIIPAAAVVLSILATALFQWKVYGMFSLAAHERDNLTFSPAGLFGVLLDRSMGILFVAPFYFMHFTGWGELRKRDRTAFLIIGAVVGAVYFLTCFHAGWWKSWAPPGRRLVVLAPLIAVPIGVMFSRAFRAGRNSVFYAFLGLSSFSVILGTLMINYSFACLVNPEGKSVNVMFGLFPWADKLYAIFPSYIEPGPHIALQSAAWLAAIAAVNIWIYLSTRKLKAPFD